MKTYNIIFLTVQAMVFFQALVFSKLDNAIGRVNLYPVDSESVSWILPWAQLFEHQLALTQGHILTRVSFSFYQKHYLR